MYHPNLLRETVELSKRYDNRKVREESKEQGRTRTFLSAPAVASRYCLVATPAAEEEVVLLFFGSKESAAL